MMFIPKNIYYTKNHLWLRKIGSYDFFVGITDFAQIEVGEIKLIEFNVNETRMIKSCLWGVVYGLNKRFSLLSPCECEITGKNPTLNHQPSQINIDPYNFWFLSISADISSHEFLTHEEYLKFIKK